MEPLINTDCQVIIMNKYSSKFYVVSLFLLIVASCSFAQSIYKGFEYGMSKSEASKEFKENKETYESIDLGNGFIYRIYKQNLVFESNKLVAVLLTPKGSAFGQSHDAATNYLEFTRGFFENLGYETFLESEWWNAPENFAASGSKWGLILNKEDKSIIVQMFPIRYELSGDIVYLANLKIWHYDTWVRLYNTANENLNEKAKESGFQ